MSKGTCSVEGCERQIAHRTWCSMHYSRWQRFGTTDRKTASSVEERLDRYTDRSGPCWLWTGGLTAEGYGIIAGKGRGELAHRVSYEHARGPLNKGQVIDHLCRVRNCVNPDHLEPVTPAENIRRGLAGFELTGMCRSLLHDVTAPGTIYVDSRGNRGCVACRRIRQTRRAEQQRTRLQR